MRQSILTVLTLLLCLQTPLCWCVDLVTLPQGTWLPIIMQESVSSLTGQVGQVIHAFVAQAVYSGAEVALTQKDRLIGKIVLIEPPIIGRHAIVKVIFTQLISRRGEKIPIQAEVATEQADNVWGGEATHGTVYKMVPYKVNGVGTYGRAMLSGPLALGQHVMIQPGTRQIIELLQPIYIEPGDKKRLRYSPMRFQN
jgi:hypothetical protein